MSFKKYLYEQEKLTTQDEAFLGISAATLYKIAGVISGIIGKALIDVLREMGHEGRMKLGKAMLAWVFAKFEKDIQMSDEEIKRLEKEMKSLRKQITSGEALIIDIYQNKLEHALKKDDKKEVKKILFQFKKSLEEWKENDALDYV